MHIATRRGRRRVVIIVAAAALAACQPTGQPTPSDAGGETGLARNVSTEQDNCWADFNADARPDLLVMNHGHSDGAQLLTDTGSGPFVLRYSFRRFDGAGRAWDWHSCAPADYDSDGDMDLYLGAGGCEGKCSSYTKSLYLQNSNGTFTDVARAWGVLEPTGRGRDSETFDVNGDGRPDLFTANETPVAYPSYNRLYVNQGGSFRDATAEYGLPTTSAAKPLGVLNGVAVDSGDYNADGLGDLAVCGKSQFLLYQSTGVRLVDLAGRSGLAGRICNDARFVDLDGDGRLDLVMTAYQRMWVRLQDASGAFPADNYTIPLPAGYDSGVGDADGDGDADIYVVNGKPGSAANAPDKLLLNAGSGATYTEMGRLPHTSEGNGDSAEIQPNWRDAGGSLIVVNNGRWGSGPRQAIEIVRG